MKTLQLNDNRLNFVTEEDKIRRHSRLSSRCASYPYQAHVAPDTHVTHQGFFDYLALAYNRHYGIVIRPDDIWYCILSELTPLIAARSKDFASLFTTTPDKKQEIIVPTGSVHEIDPAIVIDRLKDCVPVNADMFLPSFSTTTADSRLAMHVAFCDMVSPYYSYSTFLCGIPAIRLEGTKEDWAKINFGLEYFIYNVFAGHQTITDYLSRCRFNTLAMLDAMRLESVDYFDQMVKLKPCGSGSQYELSGWIMQYLFNTQQGTQLEGLPPQIACMEYTNLETRRKFKMFTGLTESTLDGNFLVPRYGRYVVSLTPEEMGKPEGDPFEIRLTSHPVHSRETKLKS